ncbi:MAG TPA: VOC family protein [Candidatus Baltobacteraceae bacterium]|jgi:predicted 3-demethylubiquinone-9 3-methyltransferase (glyoxalase superfamily)
MQGITPFLWFDNQAEEAMNFYMSIFKNSKVENVSRYSEAGPGRPGSVMVASFSLDGQPFLAINGGSSPEFKFSPAISFMVHCETQGEVDHFWEKLSEGGEKSRCGWLTDKYGVTWQIVPTILGDLMSDDDGRKTNNVMKAMLQMDKMDIARLQAAFDKE